MLVKHLLTFYNVKSPFSHFMLIFLSVFFDSLTLMAIHELFFLFFRGLKRRKHISPRKKVFSICSSPNILKRMKEMFYYIHLFPVFPFPIEL